MPKSISPPISPSTQMLVDAWLQTLSEESSALVRFAIISVFKTYIPAVPPAA